MLNTRLLSMTFLLAVCTVLATTATAAEIQRWSVQFVDDIAVMRASKNTERKFVTATITSLRNAGTEKFGLRALEPNAGMDITKFAFSIQFDEGVAEIKATADLPHEVLVSLISQPKDAGITSVTRVLAR